MCSLRAVFCNCSEFSECSMTLEIDSLRVLLSLVYNVYRIFPHLFNSPQKGSRNKERNLLVLSLSAFDTPWRACLAELSILHQKEGFPLSFQSFSPNMLGIHPLLAVPRQAAAWPVVFKTQAACSPA